MAAFLQYRDIEMSHYEEFMTWTICADPDSQRRNPAVLEIRWRNLISRFRGASYNMVSHSFIHMPIDSLNPPCDCIASQIIVVITDNRTKAVISSVCPLAVQ